MKSMIDNSKKYLIDWCNNSKNIDANDFLNMWCNELLKICSLNYDIIQIIDNDKNDLNITIKYINTHDNSICITLKYISACGLWFLSFENKYKTYISELPIKNTYDSDLIHIIKLLILNIEF